MDAFHSCIADLSEFGSIISCCKDMCKYFAYVTVSFVKRQANEVTHVFARRSPFYASPMIWVEPPVFVRALLSSDVSYG